MESEFYYFPEQASSFAWGVDLLYFFCLAVAGFFTALVCLLILYFVVRYRRSVDINRANPPASPWLEVSWSVVPFVLTMVMFSWGAILFVQQHQAPPDVEEIQVVGKQWMWKIQQPNGRQEINSLHVPVGQPVRLRMISEDVIHSFYIPAFRVKQDVLPGRYTTLWFTPTKPGRYHLFCAEYCGTSHSQMIGEVVALEPSDYSAWLDGGERSQPPAVAGEQLFERYRCNTCHNGSQPRCPPLDGLYGRPVKLADGTTVTADDDYLRESILEPSAKVVAGYQANMPTYQGQISEEGLFKIITYIKTLGQPESEPANDAENQTVTEEDETS